MGILQALINKKGQAFLSLTPNFQVKVKDRLPHLRDRSFLLKVGYKLGKPVKALI